MEIFIGFVFSFFHNKMRQCPFVIPLPGSYISLCLLGICQRVRGGSRRARVTWHATGLNGTTITHQECPVLLSAEIAYSTQWIFYWKLLLLWPYSDNLLMVSQNTRGHNFITVDMADWPTFFVFRTRQGTKLNCRIFIAVNVGKFIGCNSYPKHDHGRRSAVE